MRQHSTAAIIVLLVVCLACVSNTPVNAQTAGADGALVVAALQTLKGEYFKPVDSTKLLNAAVEALRKATNQGPDALHDIPTGVPENQAIAIFRDDFIQAAKAGTVTPTDLAYNVTRAMLASLNDSHVYYMDPAQLKEYRDGQAGAVKYAGIGVTIRAVKGDADADLIFVTDVFPGSPAAAAGVKPFDRILAINGTPIAPTATAKDVAGQVRGPEGSSVTLSIQRAGQPSEVSISRGPIHFPQVTADTVQPGVVYVRLFSFSKGVGEQLRKLIKQLVAQGPVRAIILDLRGNQGGLADEDESVAGVFLPPHTMLGQVLRRSGPTQLEARGEFLLPNATLTVLTDKYSASGSEVVTQALKDTHRATVVGEKTAGALGLARTFELPAGGMNVTVAEIVGPHYEQIERVGIAPDIQVELSVADMERGVDTQLNAALKTVGSVILPALAAA